MKAVAKFDQPTHKHGGACAYDHVERYPNLEVPLTITQTLAKFGAGCVRGLLKNDEPHAHSFKEGYRGFSTDKGAAYVVAAGTLIAGLAQTASSLVAGSPAGITGGLHDTGDVASLWDKFKNTNPDHNHDRDKSKKRAIRARRIAFGGATIAMSYSAAKLGGLELGSDNKNSDVNKIQLWVTVGVLAINSAIAVRPFKSAIKEVRKKGVVGGHEANELKDHLFADIVNSVGSVTASILALRGLYLAAESLGAGLATLNGFRFMPYKAAQRLDAAKERVLVNGPYLGF